VFVLYIKIINVQNIKIYDQQFNLKEKIMNRLKKLTKIMVSTLFLLTMSVNASIEKDNGCIWPASFGWCSLA
jgi:hypothetical protein